MKPKVAIIQFPGSNTERETILACQRNGLDPFEFLWNEPLELLKNCICRYDRGIDFACI